jgi:4-hydroxy-tetrahydrodipicolinate synthase
MVRHKGFRGVHPILPTPFTADGAVDADSMSRLVAYEVTAGVHGVAVLGFMGEAHKLSNAERRAVLRASVEGAAGRVPVWVGIRGLGTAGCIEQVQEAENDGASAVFVAPVPPQNEASLERHFREVAESTSLPLAIHDFPESFGLTIPVGVIARLAASGHVPYIKAEDPPVISKQRALLAATDGRIGIFGGLGGQWVFEELDAGAVGVMTGFAFSEVLIEVYDLMQAGDREAAGRVFDRMLPLARFEFQPGIGVALRKHVYHRRGIIATSVVRHPTTPVDASVLADFEAVAARVGLSIDQPGWVSSTRESVGAGSGAVGG